MKDGLSIWKRLRLYPKTWAALGLGITFVILGVTCSYAADPRVELGFLSEEVGPDEISPDKLRPYLAWLLEDPVITIEVDPATGGELTVELPSPLVMYPFGIAANIFRTDADLHVLIETILGEVRLHRERDIERISEGFALSDEGRVFSNFEGNEIKIMHGEDHEVATRLLTEHPLDAAMLSYDGRRLVISESLPGDQVRYSVRHGDAFGGTRQLEGAVYLDYHSFDDSADTIVGFGPVQGSRVWHGNEWDRTTDLETAAQVLEHAISPDGNVIAASLEDGRIQVWREADFADTTLIEDDHLLGIQMVSKDGSAVVTARRHDDQLGEEIEDVFSPLKVRRGEDYEDVITLYAGELPREHMHHSTFIRDDGRKVTTLFSTSSDSEEEGAAPSYRVVTWYGDDFGVARRLILPGMSMSSHQAQYDTTRDLLIFLPYEAGAVVILRGDDFSDRVDLLVPEGAHSLRVKPDGKLILATFDGLLQEYDLEREAVLWHWMRNLMLPREAFWILFLQYLHTQYLNRQPSVDFNATLTNLAFELLKRRGLSKSELAHMRRGLAMLQMVEKAADLSPEKRRHLNKHLQPLYAAKNEILKDFAQLRSTRGGQVVFDALERRFGLDALRQDLELRERQAAQRRTREERPQA